MRRQVLLLSLVSFLAAVGVNYLTKDIYPLRIREEIRMVPEEELVNLLCLDHRGLAADLLFIQVNLHSGSLMWKPLNIVFDSNWSYGLMDLITNLDPKYFTAYLFSGMGLIHRFDDVKRAKPLLEKGMKIFPDSWELPFWLGYDYYMYLEDYDIGGRYLWRAAQKPGAPKRFLALLLSTLRKGGSYEKALWVLHEMLKGTQDERLKIVYGKKLIQLENLAFLQQSVMTYHAVKGHFPSNLADLIKEGFVERLPEDPIGMKYEWDQGKRRVVIKK